MTEPCARGHTSAKVNGKCPECTREYNKAYMDKNPERYLSFSQRQLLVSLMHEMQGNLQVGGWSGAKLVPLRNRGLIIKSQGKWKLTQLGRAMAEKIMETPTLLHRRTPEELASGVKPTPCPVCDNPTDQLPTCPTLFDGVEWFEHFPTCGAAIMYFCLSVDCDWEYRWGMRRENPEWVANEELRPYWLRAKPDWQELVGDKCQL